MRETQDVFYSGRNWAENHATSRLGLVWTTLERVPPLHRLVNGVAVDLSVRKLPMRPNPLSTMADYTSWASLTDRTYDGRHLPGVERTAGSLPPAHDVGALFTRSGPMTPSDKSTVLFAYFAQWFVDGFLRSERPRRDPVTGAVMRDSVTGQPVRDPAKNDSNHEIDLIQLYGRTPEVTRQLRSGQGGLLRSQTINGEEYPPYLYEGSRKAFDKVDVVRDDQISAGQRRQLFALGSDTGNLQVGFTLMSVLFLREHNRIARELEREYGWDDERLFQTARNILTVILLKIVVEEYINHISPSRFEFRLSTTGLRNRRWHRPNWMAIEFNLLYRWHSLVPSTFRIDGRHVAVDDTLFNTDLIVERGLGACFDDASNQTAGHLGLFNSPPEIWQAELASVRQARAVKLDGYDRYRTLAGFPSARSFADISSDERVQDALRGLYGRVENVEL